MKVEQIYALVNGATEAVTGKADLVKEDLSNLVDVGQELFDTNAVDNYVRQLTDRIGKVIFVNRPYAGGVPSVMKDAWEYGSVLQKIASTMPEATETDDWKLEDGKSYDPNVFHKPDVSQKFFNSKVTFEIDRSIATNQIKESFASASEINGLLSMLENEVSKSMTVKTDALIMRTIGNFIAATANDAAKNTGSLRYVNLIQAYKAQTGKTITADKCMTDLDFLKFAAFTIGLYQSRLTKISKLFNIGGLDRFTPADKLHIVMLDVFAKAADVYLQSDTYHNDLVKLPTAETVPFWQASGTTFGFDKISSIDVVPAGATAETKVSGILAVMFDDDALGVCNENRRVTTNYNPKGDFYNNFYKFDNSYFNDMNENFVVFYVADVTA